MRFGMKWALGAVVLAGGLANPALAQQYGSGSNFAGFRAEAQVGYDRFLSEGDHDEALGYGGAIGWDGVLDDRVVVGAEYSFFNARNENCTTPGPGQSVCRKSFDEHGLNARAGLVLTRSTMVYAKAGIAINELRKRLDAVSGSFYNHYHTKGWALGGGIEQSFGQLLYGNVEYRYVNYATNSSRHRIMAGVGIRF